MPSKAARYGTRARIVKASEATIPGADPPSALRRCRMSGGSAKRRR